MHSITTAATIGVLAAGASGAGWALVQRQSMRVAERDRIASGMSPYEAAASTAARSTGASIAIGGVLTATAAAAHQLFRPGHLHPAAAAAIIGASLGSAVGVLIGQSAYRAEVQGVRA